MSFQSHKSFVRLQNTISDILDENREACDCPSQSRTQMGFFNWGGEWKLNKQNNLHMHTDIHNHGNDNRRTTEDDTKAYSRISQHG